MEKLGRGGSERGRGAMDPSHLLGKLVPLFWMFIREVFTLSGWM